MTTKQENTVTMWAVVNNLLITNQTLWFPIAAFVDAIARFQLSITSVAILSTTQSLKTTGTTTNKQTAANNLIALAVIISGLLQSFATDTNNQELYDDMAYPKSKLDKIADTDLVTKARLIHSTATDNIGSLSDYGITDPQLDLFLNLIETFANLIPSPRARQVLIKDATFNLSTIISKGNKELKNIDKLMGNFKISNPDFYTEYFFSREIIDLGSTTTTIKILAVNKTTNAFIPSAAIANNLNDVKFSTDAKGEAKGKIPFGTYTFTATAAGFQTLSLPSQKVKLGQTTNLKFQLIPQ